MVEEAGKAIGADEATLAEVRMTPTAKAKLMDEFANKRKV